ncbi:hypothetical protein AVEN_171812-1 [Araneus ventricosus]|uniref:Uncharacterized protein n=1 Tax=Araneus ventricosus TaxID=182803 RepID=A0A4Y2WHN3_ARAVE|nr:hypothetical protein AVEN_21258-1 [Araneus ventricosus]GBO36117.1 hypothetical protein AVEN_189977-1 [Araneus ventricosus]GBO36119.1 hypothetical protein AVEN_236161-1 [Araneus ventricosus]GBO36125.1 hypothetical protein AVEN_171812-1 [Araneus ventricosus]
MNNRLLHILMKLSIFCLLKLLLDSIRPSNWIREDVIFFSEHGPFPAYLKSFASLTAINAIVVELARALHYATECALTVSWYMRRPATNFEQEWLTRVANNLVSRQKIRRTVIFISENRYLFRSP